MVNISERKYSTTLNSDSSESSRISTASMKLILEKLKNQTKRSSTDQNYLSIWRKFNKFIVKLDYRPESWEDRISLYAAFLVNEGIQSSTLRCYYSAIKSILRDDGYIVNDNKVLLNSLAKACKLVNDRVITRLPIKSKLLEILLFEVERMFSEQPYLDIMYKSLFLLAYYGLFRIGELTTGSHPLKAANVHVAQNKNKILLILYSSKTHGKESRAQRIKISANEKWNDKHFFCPFKASREYLAIRGNYASEDDPLFVFSDHTPVHPYQVRKVLKSTLESVNLIPSLYSFHSLRIGRSTELVMKHNWSVDRLRIAGRWKSKVVFKYIRNY